MLKSSTLAAAAVALALPAFAGAAFTATLETPVAEKERFVANKAVWTCEGETCTAELARKSVTVRVCKKFVKEAGAVTAFGTEASALNEEDLATCNAAAKG